MAKAIIINPDIMTKEQKALFVTGVELLRHPLLTSYHTNKLEPYLAGGIITRRNTTYRKASFRVTGATLVSALKLNTVETLMGTGWFKDFFSRIWTKAKLSDMEAVSKFLLSHNHTAQKVAEGIFPAENDQDIVWQGNVEKVVAETVGIALDAAKELSLPALTSILKARKTVAEQRAAPAQAKTLGL